MAFGIGLAATIACGGAPGEPDHNGDGQIDAAEAAAAAEAEPDTDNDGFFAQMLGKDEKVTVPSGTVLTIVFDDTVSSATSRAGDSFSARVAHPVAVDGRVAIEDGSIVYGRVVDAQPSKRIGGRARLNLDFTSLRTPAGEEVPIAAAFHGLAKSQTKKDAATIGGATAGGAVIGRILGHKDGKEADGTGIGAAVGAAVGTGIAASNRGQEVVLAGGATLELRLDAPVTVPVEG
jgi:hypothetical protein